jgi:hypothetical protein
MARKCSTCQHIKRAEIDRRLASGEPGRQVAQDHGLNPSSVHRHRVNCLGLASSNAIMKEVARGTAAVACLPSRNDLSGHYFDLQTRLDEIVRQAEQDGQPKTAITGLNSMRQTLDSLMRLSGHDKPSTEVNVAINTASHLGLDLTALAERLINKFDHDPQMKGRIAQAVFDLDDDSTREDGTSPAITTAEPEEA